MFSKVLIPGCYIICEQEIMIDFLIPNNNLFLLKGMVFTPTGKPLPNAAIEVIRKLIIKGKVQEKSLGITFSKEDGTYAITLPICPNSDYILLAYSPMTSP